MPRTISGHQAKLANQIGIASQVVAMAEALVYAHRAGIDLAVWLPAVAGGGAGSFSMTNYAPRALRRDFDPGFFVDHFIKDMGLALDQCKLAGLHLPGLALANRLFVELQTLGHGAKGVQALILALEQMNSVTVPAVDVGVVGAPTNPLLITPTSAQGETELDIADTERGRVTNLSAGPAVMDNSVMREARSNFLSHNGTGMGLMEMSHRDAHGPVQRAIADATSSVRELLAVPADHHVLWMAGGAHAQFAASILNTLGDKRQVDVVQSGVWSEKFRVSEAERLCPDGVNVAWTGESEHYLRVGGADEWQCSTDSAFVHVCLNETINGVEYLVDPELPAGSPFISCDATSTLMSRPMDISKYGIVYASAGKNLGPAGATLVIVKDELLGRAADSCPSVLNYTKQAIQNPIPSLYNTPPTYNLYMISLMLREYERRGGLCAIAEEAKARAALIYDIIDNSDGFYNNQVAEGSRSRMSIPFHILDGPSTPEGGELMNQFIESGQKLGIQQLFAHPLYPGLRVTMYNGLSTSSVETVAAHLERFYIEHRGHNQTREAVVM